MTGGVFCVFGGLTATGLLGMKAFMGNTDVARVLPLFDSDGGCSFSNDALTAETKAVMLLVADCCAGIALVALHLLFSALLLLGRTLFRLGAGGAHASLVVATFYSSLVLFALAGTLSVCDFKAVRGGGVNARAHARAATVFAEGAVLTGQSPRPPFRLRACGPPRAWRTGTTTC